MIQINIACYTAVVWFILLPQPTGTSSSLRHVKVCTLINDWTLAINFLLLRLNTDIKSATLWSTNLICKLWLFILYFWWSLHYAFQRFLSDSFLWIVSIFGKLSVQKHFLKFYGYLFHSIRKDAEFKHLVWQMVSQSQMLQFSKSQNRNNLRIFIHMHCLFPIMRA